MAKGGKLTKLKSVLKKMQSFKIGRSNSGSQIVAAVNSSSSSSSFDDDDYNHRYNHNHRASEDLHPVYVGKSRRRYLVSSDVIENPLFRELIDRSGDSDDCVTVGCEVVLFEHLLWMLENSDPLPESLDELVEFYAC